MKRNRFLLHIKSTAIFLVTIVFISGCGIFPVEEEFKSAPIVKQSEKATFTKFQVIKGDIIQSEGIPCIYDKGETQELSFQQEAIIVDKVYVKKGDEVKKGDILAELRMEDVKLEIMDAEFNLKLAKLNLKHEKELMNAELEKQRKISEDESVLASIRNQYTAQIQAYKDEIELCEMKMESAEEKKKEYSLYADMNGTVTFIKKGLQGSRLHYDSTCIIISGKSNNIFIAETDQAFKLKKGDKINVDAVGVSVECIIKHNNKKNKVFFEPVVVPDTLDNDTNATATFIIEQRLNVIYVPSTAVYTVNDKNVVYIENEEGVKTPKEVEIGFSYNHRTEIISGLEVGDSIITN